MPFLDFIDPIWFEAKFTGILVGMNEPGSFRPSPEKVGFSTTGDPGPLCRLGAPDGFEEWVLLELVRKWLGRALFSSLENFGTGIEEMDLLDEEGERGEENVNEECLRDLGGLRGLALDKLNVDVPDSECRCRAGTTGSLTGTRLDAPSLNVFGRVWCPSLSCLAKFEGWYDDEGTSNLLLTRLTAPVLTGDGDRLRTLEICKGLGLRGAELKGVVLLWRLRPPRFGVIGGSDGFLSNLDLVSLTDPVFAVEKMPLLEDRRCLWWFWK